MAIIVLYVIVMIAFSFKVFELAKEIRKEGFKKEKMWRLTYNLILLVGLTMLLVSRTNKI